MKDLGRTMAEMYPSSSDSKEYKNKKHYERVSLPKSMFGKAKLSLDDVHHLHLKAKITGHSPESDTVHMEVLEGEKMESPKEEKAEGETYLGGAK